MLPALGAVSSVLDALLSPASSKSPSQTAGFNQASSNPFDLTGNAAASASSTSASCYSGCSQISPATMSALLAAQSQSTTASSAPTSRADALKDLFSQLDANGDGQVSKAEFESALGAGGTNLAQADDVFSKLDKNGDGSVSLDELTSALKGAGGKGHHHHHHVAGSDGPSGAGVSSSTSGSSSDPLLQALSGASSTQVTNSDGTTTTSVTYADGSKVTLTSAPTKPSSTAASSYNFVEQLIQREASAISSGATGALSLNV
jgi:EF-hand domain pair